MQQRERRDERSTLFPYTALFRSKVALFSATMPSAIRRIAKTHLRDPQEVTIKTRTTTADNIRQRYWIVGGGISELEALTRLLERSEEHTSELQSRFDLVCRLLLE